MRLGRIRCRNLGFPCLAKATRHGAPRFCIPFFAAHFCFYFFFFSLLAGREEAEDAYSCGGADVDFAVGDHGGDVFVAGAELVAAVGGLVGVIDLDEGFGVVGVEDGGVDVFGGPDDGVLSGVGGDAGSGSGIGKGGGSLRRGGGWSLALLNWNS